MDAAHAARDAYTHTHALGMTVMLGWMRTDVTALTAWMLRMLLLMWIGLMMIMMRLIIWMDGAMMLVS